MENLKLLGEYKEFEVRYLNENSFNNKLKKFVWNFSKSD